MPLTQVTVTGTYVNADGGIPEGEVALQLTEEMRAPVTKRVVTTVPIIRVLDNAGAIPQPFKVYANNDAEIVPPTVSYTITENIEGAASSPSATIRLLGSMSPFDTSQIPA